MRFASAASRNAKRGTRPPGFGGQSNTLRVCDSLYRLDAPPADRRVLGIRTNIGLPMPATLAFLAGSLGDGNCQSLLGPRGKFELGDIQEFAQRFRMRLGIRKSRCCARQN